MTPAKKAPAKKVAAKKTAAKKAAPAARATPVKASARALSMFDEKFGKRFGADSIRRKRTYRVVSTGSLTLDQAMGCGGYIVGRIVEIWGPESVAKSTLAMIGVANFQREFPDKVAGWIDMERTFDWDWAALNGVDTTRIRVIIPHDAEEVSDMARSMIESGLFSIVVLDSVGGMVTGEEMAKDAEQVSVGTAAKVVTRMVKQAAVLCDETETTMIIVNQVRAIIGPQGGNTTGGGYALKHVTTHKIRLKRTGDDPFTIGTNDNKEYVGFVISAVVEKNKVAPPRRVGTFALFNQETAQYGPVGIDRAREAYVMGKRLGIISSPSQGWYLLPDEAKVNGEAKTIAYLREHVDVLDTIRRDMLARIADQVADEVPDETPEANDASGEVVLDFSGGLDYEVDVKMIDQLRMDEDSRVAAEAAR